MIVSKQKLAKKRQELEIKLIRVTKTIHCAKDYRWINLDKMETPTMSAVLLLCATFQLRCGLPGTWPTNADQADVEKDDIGVTLSTEGHSPLPSCLKEIQDP